MCPTGATYKDEMGRVEIDYDKCIGCRMCMAACPYNARVVQLGGAGARPWTSTTAMQEVPVRPKRRGREVHAVHASAPTAARSPCACVCCPTHARIFGDLDDPASEVSKAVVERKAHALLEEQGTRPQVYCFD